MTRGATMRDRITRILGALLMVAVGSAGMCDPPPPQHPERPHKTVVPPGSGPATVGAAIDLPGAVVFEQGSDQLKPESDVVLEVVADYLTAKRDVTLLRVEGYADDGGSVAMNQTLSEKRAMAVA